MDITFPQKMQFLFQPSRYKVAYGGRAGMKSWSFARALLIRGVQQPTRVLCVRELQNSIQESVHKLLKDQIEELQLSSYYEVLQSSIRGPNGTEFNYEGIRNNVRKIKSYEGVDVCWAEEADGITDPSWDIVIPTIRKEGSEIWISFNPNLETDATYRRFVVDPPPNAVVQMVSWRDNPWLTTEVKAEIENLKNKDYDDYLHVWEGECKKMLEGAVYAKQLRAAELDGRITSVPFDPLGPVSVWMDLGRRDKTCLWFGQYLGMQRRMIDYYENTGEHIDHYLKKMREKDYIYDTIWLPHDAKAKTLGTKMSIEEQVRAKGFKVRIVKRLSQIDGINAARTIFGNTWFDKKKCASGLNALKHYRFAIDPQTKQYSDEPVHDEHSDGADAFRYYAVSSAPGSIGSGSEFMDSDDDTPEGLAAKTKRWLEGFVSTSSGGNGWLGG